MNDRNNMDSTGTVNSDDVLVADETNVKGGHGSVCHGQFNCGRYFRPLIVYFCIAMALVFSVMGFVDLKVNAAENEFVVDENYINSTFSGYNYWVIVNNPSTSAYQIIVSDTPILYSSGGYYLSQGCTMGGYCLMTKDSSTNSIIKYESSVLSSFNITSDKGFCINPFMSLGSFSIVYSNHNVYKQAFVDGYYYASSELTYARSPITTPDEETTPNITVDCKFTDENIVGSINTLNDNLVAKMDIVIMLLIVIIALRMFSPLANNHKRGLQKKEK